MRLIQTNNRYFELFQTSGGLDAEITDDSFQRYYHSGDFPELSPELRKIVINRSSVQEQGIRINHIPIRETFVWSEDISVLLDQYQGYSGTAGGTDCQKPSVTESLSERG